MPQLLADGSVGDTDEVQMPTTDGEFDGDDEGGVPAGPDEVPLPDVDEGEITLEACSNPQPPIAIAASAAATSETDF